MLVSVNMSCTSAFSGCLCTVYTFQLHCNVRKMMHIPTEMSLQSSEGVGVGAILGGVNNHIKEFMLHPLKDQRSLNALKFKCLKYTGENTALHGKMAFLIKACLP